MKKLIITTAVLSAPLSSIFAQQAAPAQSPLGGFLPLIVIFAIFYFLLIRPQQKKAKEHQKMVNALKKDDRVITSGGIHGTVIGTKGTIVEVKIAEGVKVQIEKSAVATVVTREPEAVTPEIIK